MRGEPLFMYDLHRKQSKEYEQHKKLNLRQFVKYLNRRAGMREEGKQKTEDGRRKTEGGGRMDRRRRVEEN